MEDSIHLITLSCGKEVLLKSSSNLEQITIEIQSKNDPSQFTGNIRITDLESKAKELEKSLHQLEAACRK